MECTSEKKLISPMQASSSRFAHEYVDLDSSEGLPTNNEPNNLNSGEHASVGEENLENHDEQDEVVLKHKHRKTLDVWEEFVVVTLKNGIKKVECIHCKTQLAKVKSGTTSTYKRHLVTYLQRKQYQRTQQMLSFQPDADTGCEKPPSLILPNPKYDANKMREAIAAWIVGTEQPFNVVEDDLFVCMMKTANPLFEKVSRVTTKTDCIKVYEHEKKRLKALTNTTSTISLTTDCWKSSHQRIEYMVITGHFIDYKWRLHKRVLNFVHVPPPRTRLDVFPSYAKYEPKFQHLPNEQDWENVTSACEILKVFKVCTNIISGSHYPTTNLYLIEVYKVKQVLDNGANSEDQFIRDMVKAMKEKFDKYWGECHLLMAIASVLDPRFKKWLIGMSYNILYTTDQAAKNIKEVENALEDMYDDYLEMHDVLVKEAATNGIGSSKGRNGARSNEEASNGSEWEGYGKYIKEADLQKSQVSELKMYYDEGLYIIQGGIDSFNVLEWWNIHKLKFPILSKMAMDVLAIPISTVASEATFSTGGRVIEPFRSSLAPDTVQMLICGGDWVRQTFGLKKKHKEEVPIDILLPDVKHSN